jgi:tetratricopeptide (TPR) repeat protein
MGFGGTRSARTAGIALACLVCSIPEAQAQRHPAPAAAKERPNPGKARASELFKKSAEAYMRGDFNQAITLLDEAYALDPQPVLLYNKARAHEGLGHGDEAIALYEQYLAQEPNSADRGAIEQRLVTLKRQKEERSAVDRERTEVEKERAAVEKERATPAPPPPPPPAEPPHRRSALPYVVMGVGAAGLATGTVFGLMALSREDAAIAEPVQKKSGDLRDTGTTFATVSNISFIAGGVLLAAGALWWVLDGSGGSKRGGAASPARLGLGLGPGFFSASGTFQ